MGVPDQIPTRTYRSRWPRLFAAVGIAIWFVVMVARWILDPRGFRNDLSWPLRPIWTAAALLAVAGGAFIWARTLLAGVDISPAGVHVRNFASSHRLKWADIETFYLAHPWPHQILDYIGFARLRSGKTVRIGAIWSPIYVPFLMRESDDVVAELNRFLALAQGG